MKQKKKKNRNSWLRLRKKKPPLTSIGAADHQKLAGTTTGELFQPMRLHYAVPSLEDFSTSVSKLTCIEYDSSKNRWAWLYLGESQSLDFERGVVDEDNPVVLGEFLYKNDNTVVLNVRSFERGIQAVEFFDKYISRKIAKLTHVTICNRLFKFEEAAAMANLDQYFEATETLVRNPEKINQELMERTAGIDNEKERAKAGAQLLNELNSELPELEQFPVHFYDEGIAQLNIQLTMSKAVAVQHWQGNTGYTPMDAIHDVLTMRSTQEDHEL